MTASILQEGLPQLGREASLSENLEKFLNLVLEKNQVMNLTAITDPDQAAALHLLDSLAPAAGRDFSGQEILDVGTGAGFPGVPLAIAFPQARVTLLDSLGKRVDFLKESCGALGLANVTCVHARAEEYAARRREAFQVVISRAVANLTMLSELCLPFAAVGGLFLAMKSTDCEAELEAAKPAIRLLGGKIEAITDYTIPTTEVVHRLVVIRKASPTPARYPRRFAQMKKQPL